MKQNVFLSFLSFLSILKQIRKVAKCKIFCGINLYLGSWKRKKKIRNKSDFVYFLRRQFRKNWTILRDAIDGFNILFMKKVLLHNAPNDKVDLNWKMTSIYASKY